jgi:hypothetical protein
LGTNKFLLQYKLFETYNTLAELLPQYKKIGITGNTWLDEIGGYTKGFNEYKIILHKPLKEPGLHTKKIADEALLQLKLFTKDKPLFFWVHFLKPHAPCNPPKDTKEIMFLQQWKIKNERK